MPQDDYDRAVRHNVEVRTKLEETEAKLTQTKQLLVSRDKEMEALGNSPEYQFWKIRVGQHTPRERLKLLKEFTDKFPKDFLTSAANEAFVQAGTSVGDAADELLKQSKYDDAATLMKGLSEGLPNLVEFERQWLEKIRKQAEYGSRIAAEEQFRERLKAGRVPVGEIIGVVQGQSSASVLEKLGRPDHTALAALGKEFTYYKGAFNSDTGAGEMLVILIASSPVNKVLSVRTSGTGTWVDEDVKREVTRYLSPR